jgi:hypothetical protein
MILRLIFLLGVNCLLSAALVAMVVTRSLDLIQKIESALDGLPHRGRTAAVYRSGVKVCLVFVICGALTWRIVRQLPFSL